MILSGSEQIEKGLEHMDYRDRMKERGAQLNANSAWDTPDKMRQAFIVGKHFHANEYEATRGNLPPAGAPAPRADVLEEWDESERQGRPYVDPPGTYGKVSLGGRPLTPTLKRWIDVVGWLGHGDTSHDEWDKAKNPEYFAGRYFPK